MLKPLFQSLALLCLVASSAVAQPATQPRVSVDAPVKRAPKPDEIGAALLSGTLRGALIYACDQPSGDAKNGRGFLAFYTQTESAANPEQVVVYPLHIAGADVPFDPQFAPDGKTVLFKVGVIDGPYHLFALDLKSGAVRLAVKRALTLRRVVFSPDGQYLAYVAGQVGDETQPLRLLCNEWQHDREKLIVRNDGTFNGFAWSAPHTLCFTALPAAPKAHPGTDHKGEVAALPAVVGQQLPTVARPNIYVAAPEDGQVQLMMLEGNRPQPSPDGKWVAFFGMETPTNKWALRPNWQSEPSYVALSVMRADGLGRMAINEEKKTYPQLFWKNDNRHMVAASYVPVTPPEKRREVSEPVLKGSFEVRTWDTENGHFERNLNLKAPALGATSNADGDFAVQVLGLSRDEKSLIVVAQAAPGEWKFSPESALPGGATVLESVDLASGKPQILATLPRCTGVDWWQPMPAP